MNLPTPTIDCVDLFCGVGGLTHGLVQGGIRVTAGVDLDGNCRVPFESNNTAKFFEKDIRLLSGDDLALMFGEGDLRLLAGCAPCQPFSTYSRVGRQSRKNTMWDLVVDFGRLIREVEPDFITMENVPQLIQHPVFEAFLQTLSDYSVSWSIVECARYGIPQTRKRLVLLASKLGPIELLSPSANKGENATVRAAISALLPLSAGEADPNDALHSACRLSEVNLRRIRASKPGGTWREWNEELVAKCHRKISGATFPSVYGRMEWDAPSPTITTQCFGFGNGRFGHPEQDRAITLREAAILQTFPPRYQFLSNGERVRFNVLGRLIGNAVPVRIGEVIAQSLLVHVHEFFKAHRSTRKNGSRKALRREPPPTRERSALMARIGPKHTAPERFVRALVYAMGYRYRLHRRDLPGTPDLVFPRLKKVIFVHGCFWHRHPGCSRTTNPKIRAAFWSEKFATNVKRDAQKEKALRKAGWTVLVVWECESARPKDLTRKLERFLRTAKKP
jgi:DNA (cytosine-5)-methyltransferase 1